MPQEGKKMTFDRIQITENFFGDLCTEMSSVTKKKARLRDKYDDMCRIVRGYSDTARFNETLFNGLLNFSKSCTLLADVKDMEVQRLQSKTVRDLANYENVCKNTRETLKHSLLLRGKEQLKYKTQQRNAVIEKDANAQSIDESQCNQDFESNLLKFERQKLSDIRQILMDFTLIQLKETVASMEILSSMYNEIAAIDADRDLVEFEQKFLNRDMNTLKQTSRSQSLSALTSKPQPLKRSTMSNSTISLSSPNKDINSNMKNGKKHQSTDSESDDEESSKSTEESSESDEEESKSSSQTKQSSENQSSYLDDDDDDDDDAVRVHQIKSTAKKPNEAALQSGKRSAPVPQVRFSKMVNHMKK